MPVNDQYANNPASTLSAGIAAGDTTLTVVSATAFSAVPQFRIIIDAEIMLVTGVAGTTFTIARGIEGTTAASHSSGVAVTQILTRDGLMSVGSQIHLSDSYLALPSSSLVGRTFWPNNGAGIYRDTGSAWNPWGPISRFVSPDDSTFSWINQGTGSVDTSRGGIYLLAPAQNSGDQPRIRYVATPGVPYTLTAHFAINGFPANFWAAGLILLDNTNASVAFNLTFNSTLDFSIDKFNSSFAYVSSYGSFPSLGTASAWPADLRWFRIQDNGTNLIFSVSSDGNFWLAVESHGRTDFITPTRIGYFAKAVNASHDNGIRLLSWEITTP